MKNKNVLILINSMGSGGAERVVSLLNDEMIDDNVNLHVLTLESQIAFPLNKKINYLELSSRTNKFYIFLVTFFIAPFKIKRYCVENNIDFIFSHLYRANYSNALSKFIGNKVISIAVQHSHASNSYNTNSLKDKLNRFLIKSLLPKLDYVYTVSELIRLDLISNFNLKSKQLINVANPINLSLISEQSKQLVKNNFLFGHFTFITVGSFIKRKNHEMIIRAAKIIEDLDFKIIIMGKGELNDSYVNLISELDLDDKINIVGFDNNPFKFIANSDCLINSSNAEGLPMAILEALACNLCVVSTDCLSGPREILCPDTNLEKQISNGVEYGKYGVLFPINKTKLLAEVMKKIIEDKDLVKSYKLKAKERALFFNSNNIYNLYKKPIHG